MQLTDGLTGSAVCCLSVWSVSRSTVFVCCQSVCQSSKSLNCVCLVSVCPSVSQSVSGVCCSCGVIYSLAVEDKKKQQNLSRINGRLTSHPHGHVLKSRHALAGIRSVLNSCILLTVVPVHEGG